MAIFEEIYKEGHEQVVFFSDPTCGLKAIIAIHNTVLGPSLGGTRMWPYASEQDALDDVLRLSKGMTYKASISGLNLGGGKAVIIGDPTINKSEALFRSYGRFIQSLNGRYITAEDVNMSVEDIEYIAMETKFVTGISKSSGGSGNPSPFTALGVYRGMEACCQNIWGSRKLKGRSIALQGAGSVGTHLGKMLHDGGAKVYVCDINMANLQNFKKSCPSAEIVSVEEIFDVDCDIYAPCALGATINDQSIEKMKVKVICGAANNQLATPRHGDILMQKGILYAPDYLVNAGGLMNVSMEFEGWSEEKATQRVNTIFDKTLQIFKFSKEQNLPIYKAANLIAEKRIESIQKIKGNFLAK